jgi:glycosyltransferase involved in cell wall biosynthesis
MKHQSSSLQADVADRQRDVLDYVLKSEEQSSLPSVPRVSVREARAGETQVEFTSTRETTRLLFISRDTSLLNQTTQTLDGYLNLCDVFDEVHIVILQTGLPPHHPVLRASANVWLYIASATHWWGTPFSALRLIERQLVFADGFRPDLIVAHDPFESALVAYWASRKYKRPTQLHIRENFTEPRFLFKAPENRWRRRLAKYLVPRFDSVRATTNQIYERLVRDYPSIVDVALLPRFNNYSALAAATPAFSIKEKYAQFAFIILYVGELHSGSTVFQAIDAARFLLRNPAVGLVIVGDGPIRTACQKRVGIFGITEQVVFEKSVDDIVSYLKSADVLVVTDTTSTSDELVLKGAAAGIPLVMSATALRSDLFVDGESAFITPVADITMIATRLNRLLNENSLRHSLITAATLVVNTHLHEDPEQYRIAYRDSVEAALVVGEADEPVIQAT